MEKIRFKKVPFDLGQAKKITNKETKGRIVTRDGRQVRIICFDKSGVQSAYPIVALVQVHPDEERTFSFSKEGVYSLGNKTCYDLCLEVPTSNFEPQKWQPCLVRNGEDCLWVIQVYSHTDYQGRKLFYDGCYLKQFTNVLPLSESTKRLYGTRKSYEQLI